MTYLVLRASAPNEQAFYRAVEMHVKELVDWDKHMTAVRAGHAQFYPPPHAPMPDVEHAVRRDQQPDGSVKFTIDYRIVDRLGVPDGDRAALNARKVELMQEVLNAENADLAGMYSYAQWRLLSLKGAAAQERVNEAVVAKKTPDEADEAIVAEHRAGMKKMQSVQIYYAGQMVRIEALTFDDVNDWKLEIFGVET